MSSAETSTTRLLRGMHLTGCHWLLQFGPWEVPEECWHLPFLSVRVKLTLSCSSFRDFPSGMGKLLTLTAHIIVKMAIKLCSFQWWKIHQNLTHVPSVRSRTFRRILQRWNISDSWIFLREPKRSTWYLAMQSSSRYGVILGSKGSFVAESKTFFDLFGNNPASFACPPAAARTLPCRLPAPNLQKLWR